MKGTRTGLLLLVTLVAACASSPPEPEEAATAKAEPELPIETTPEMLADLLVAEVAAQRNALEVTLAHYARVARQSHDPEVLEQAARLADYMQEYQLAHELSELWLRQAPGNRKAHEIAALSAINLGEPDKAVRHIDALMADEPRKALAELVSRARGLDEEGNNHLLAALSSLVERYPEQAPLWYARALHLQNTGHVDDALEACNQALALRPGHQKALLLRGELLMAQERFAAALDHVDEVIDDHPDLARAHAQRARLLILTGRNKRAAQAIAEIAERFPESPELRFSLALFALDQQQPALARQALSVLLEEGYRVDDMHLYLGRTEDMAQRPEQAIEHFLSVSGGEQRLRARIQAARLMYETGQPERARELLTNLRDSHPGRMPTLYAAQSEMLSRSGRDDQAMALLNEALTELPDNTELLYARAMIAERMGRLGQVEADLRRVLETEPGDPVALNALGYTLADHDVRLDEARQYIEQALEKQPDNPAFIDSMGWLLYREGNLEEARQWLERAWEKLNDPEVGAHYGEVLWQLGNRDHARAVWGEALDEHPGSESVLETMERLGAGQGNAG